MKPPVNDIYKLYKNYVTELHRAISTLPLRQVGSNYTTRLQSFEEFSNMWAGWECNPEIQNKWLTRFSSGYSADVIVIQNLLQSGFGRSVVENKAA